MSRRLQRHVHVRDEAGVFRVFAPGDDVPAWAVDKIRNPGAWADGASPTSAPPAQAHPEPRRAADRAEAATEPEAGPPPQVGRGSSTTVWRSYAEANGVQVAPDADRADIIDACRAAGVAIE